MNILKEIAEELYRKIENELKNADNIITSPSEKKISNNKLKIFLGGTIDSGKSEDWQKKICKKYANDKQIIVFNPRRPEWPSDSDHNEVIRQIKWEHKRMDESDYIVMNILPDSKSPISLMEIGMYCHSNKLLVFCTDKFYRYDNVKVVCEKYDIKLFNTNKIEDIINQIDILSK